jgi:hypothetical protein
MFHCDCGFDYTMALLKGRRMVSYAIIPEKNYSAAIRREYAIVVEKNAERRLALIAKAVSSVGRLLRCPDCGAWFLTEPVEKGIASGYLLLRGVPPTTKKTVRRKGGSPPAQTRKRASSASASRR